MSQSSLRYIRKRHPKSRGGCLRCKSRHVKCDELVPCTNCLKRNENCGFENTNTKKACTRCSATPGKGLTLDWTREIYLMHHFSTVTSSSLSSPDLEVEHVWKFAIPELAVGHPYLMNGLLALSALHLAHLRPHEETIWAQPAFQYQNKAITAVNSMLPRLVAQEEGNIHAIFGVGVILSMSSMAVTKFPTKLPILSDVISSVVHIRGVQQVCCASGQVVASSPLALLFRTGMDGCSKTAALRLPIARQFSILKDKFKQELRYPVQICMLVALQALETIYAEIEYLVQQKTEIWYPGLVWKWPAILSQQYVAYLQANDPAALVVFAHFSVLSVLFDEWYLSGWSERALLSISDTLPASWRELSRWPEDQLKDELRSLRGTSDKLGENDESSSSCVAIDV